MNYFRNDCIQLIYFKWVLEDFVYKLLQGGAIAPHRQDDVTKMLGKVGEMDWTVIFTEEDNESSDSKRREFLDYLNNYQLYKEHPLQWIWASACCHVP
jgi:hypothetical protein